MYKDMIQMLPATVYAIEQNTVDNNSETSKSDHIAINKLQMK